MTPTDYGTAMYWPAAYVALLTAWTYAKRLRVIYVATGAITNAPLADIRAFIIAAGIVVGFTFIGANELYFGYLRTFEPGEIRPYTLFQVATNIGIKMGAIVAGLLHIWADRATVHNRHPKLVWPVFAQALFVFGFGAVVVAIN